MEREEAGVNLGKSFAGKVMAARTLGMSLSTTVYVRDAAALERFQAGLKLRVCPHCRLSGFLIFYGWLWGYALSGSRRQKRGRRVFCSNRFRKVGCGKTFSALFSFLLKGRLIPAFLVEGFLENVLAGACRRAAWLSLPHRFSLESGYRVWRDWVEAQWHVRSWLWRKIPPRKTSREIDPWHETWEHLQEAFPKSLCVIAAFQEHFQEPFFPN